MTILQYRNCPDCEAFLAEHPSLRFTGFMEQRRRMDGQSWVHVTSYGRLLHAAVTGATMSKQQAGRGKLASAAHKQEAMPKQ